MSNIPMKTKPQGLSRKKINKTKVLDDKLLRINIFRSFSTPDLLLGIKPAESLSEKPMTFLEKLPEYIRRDLSESNGLHSISGFNHYLVDDFLNDVAKIVCKASKAFFNPWTKEELGEIKTKTKALLRVLPKDKEELVLLGRRTGDLNFFLDLSQKLSLVKEKISKVEPKRAIKQKGTTKEFRARNFLKNEIEKSIDIHFGKKLTQKNALLKALLQTDIISRLGKYPPESVKNSLFK